MKQIKKISISALLSLFVLVTSCDNDDPIVPVQPTVVGIAQNDTTFSLLVAAIEKANLVGTLSDLSKSYTVFAPTNTAFRTAGYNLAAINALSANDVRDVLVPLLTYHVVGTKVQSGGVPASDTVKTLNGKNLYASKNGNGVFLNGIKVTAADISASNGVVHVINKLLVPPTQTIAQIVINNPNFSLLKTAVVKANLAGALGNPGKYTVFAPVNAGFPASLDTDAEINNALEATVFGIVAAHTFTTNIFAGDLVAGVTPATLNATKTLTISLMPANVKITGSSNAASTIDAVDIVATNGVIHIIGTLLQ